MLRYVISAFYLHAKFASVIISHLNLRKFVTAAAFKDLEEKDKNIPKNLKQRKKD